jgi:hypothetical protein
MVNGLILRPEFDRHRDYHEGQDNDFNRSWFTFLETCNHP